MITGGFDTNITCVAMVTGGIDTNVTRFVAMVTGGIDTNAKDRTPWHLWTKGPREYFLGCVFDFKLNDDYDYLDLPRYSRDQVKTFFKFLLDRGPFCRPLVPSVSNFA